MSECGEVGAIPQSDREAVAEGLLQLRHGPTALLRLSNEHDRRMFLRAADVVLLARAEPTERRGMG